MTANTIQDKVLIFFSYAQQDEPIYTELLHYLIPFISEQPVQILEDRNTNAAYRKEVEKEYIQKAHIVVPLVSISYISDHINVQQMQEMLDRYEAEPDKLSIFPLLTSPCGWQQTRLQGLRMHPKNGLPLSEWSKPNAGLLTISRELAAEIRKVVQKKFATKNSSTVREFSQDGQLHTPYVGLRAFGLREASYFFGRERLIQNIQDKLLHIIDEEAPAHNNRLLVAIGASGSGKTSIINAGILPRLAQGALKPYKLESSKYWIYLNSITPGSKPIESLTETLQNAIDLNRMRPYEIASTLTDSKLGLHLLAKDIWDNEQESPPQHWVRGKVVLVIDQFEELFTLVQSEEERAHFIKLLVTAVTQHYGPLVVILTLRSDFYGHMQQYPELFQLMDANRIDIGPMIREEIREAIEGPAELADVDLHLAPDLINALLDDMERQKDALPLLQFTLKQLSQHYQKTNGTITKQAYQDLGGLGGALQKHAESIYSKLRDELGAHQEEVVCALFLRLVKIGNEEGNIVRRRVPLADCLPVDRKKRELTDRAITAFVNAYLLTTDRDTSQNDAERTLEVSHEALLRDWSRLVGWIHNEKTMLRFRDTLSWDVHEWKQQKQAKDLLYKDKNLKVLRQMEKTGSLNADEKKFAQTSIGQQYRDRALQSLISIIVISTLITALIYGINSSTPKDTVTNTNDNGQGSLRQVIAAAHDGAIIQFASNLRGKTINITSGDLDIKQNLTLHGLNTPTFTTSDSQGPIKADAGTISLSSPQQARHHIHIAPGKTVTFDKLAIINSFVDQDGIIYNEGHLTLTDCKIAGNKSDYNGGALVNAGEGNLTLNHCELSSNQSNGNGGAFYNEGGTVIINDSILYGNQSIRNGGSIFGLKGNMTISDSQIEDNSAGSDDNSTYYGGGIDIQNSQVSLIRSTIQRNTTHGNGGGVAIVGGNATIDTSTITQNTALNGLGGGIAVERNSENSYTSQAVLLKTEINDNPKTEFFAGKNSSTAKNAKDQNIEGNIIKDNFNNTANRINIQSNNINDVTGSPPPHTNPPENSKNYLGTVDIDAFCQSQNAQSQNTKYSHGKPFANNPPPTTATNQQQPTLEIQCVSLNASTSHIYTAQFACQWRYPLATNVVIIDRLADYYDPSSWQCYANVKKLDVGITDATNLDAFCKGGIPAYPNGLKDQRRYTAYDWKCLDTNNRAIGISVADACRYLSNNKDAFDRLASFNTPDGWECWAPT